MLFATLILTVAAADRVALVLGLEEIRLFRKLLAVAPAILLVGYDAMLRRRIVFLSVSLLALVWVVVWLIISDIVFLRPVGEAIIRALMKVFVW